MENIFYNTSEIFVLDDDYLKFLKLAALRHDLKRSRVCLHGENKESTQEMIIVVHKSSIIQPHRHPVGKSESYHVIEGSLAVNIFRDNGMIGCTVNLYDDSNPRIYRILGGIWHQPVPLTEWVVYHEVFEGPFSKESDVIYLDV